MFICCANILDFFNVFNNIDINVLQWWRAHIFSLVLLFFLCYDLAFKMKCLFLLSYFIKYISSKRATFTCVIYMIFLLYFRLLRLILWSDSYSNKFCFSFFAISLRTSVVQGHCEHCFYCFTICSSFFCLFVGYSSFKCSLSFFSLLMLLFSLYYKIILKKTQKLYKNSIWSSKFSHFLLQKWSKLRQLFFYNFKQNAK